jgi:effector-binding domain-containing protein
MSLSDLGIEHKIIAPTLAAVVRQTVGDRKELGSALSAVKATIPAELIDGPGFCIFRWVTSVRDGFDVEIGFPIKESFASQQVRCRTLDRIQVLSLVHRGPVERLADTQRLLFGTAASLGITSDEFMREVYPENSNPLGPAVEVQFVVHDWPALLRQHACRILGDSLGEELTVGGTALTMDCGVGPRFDWVKGIMQRLDSQYDDDQAYHILSSCAHVYPAEQLAKLRQVYAHSFDSDGDAIAAVDAVLDFMASDPGWGNRPQRECRTVTASKQPRDPAGFAAATTKADRAKAYCFCPLIRNRLDQGMPATFCNCGAGWFRQQWEAALGSPVRVRIVESLLRGDERCTFAFDVPEDI